jgi:hypothetical protein
MKRYVCWKKKLQETSRVLDRFPMASACTVNDDLGKWFFFCHDDEVISLLARFFFSEVADRRWPALTRLSSVFRTDDIQTGGLLDTSWSEAIHPTLLFSSHLASFSSLAHRQRPWRRACGSLHPWRGSPVALLFSPSLTRRRMWEKQPGGV